MKNKVLLVNGSASHRGVLGQLFVRFGFETVQAASCAAAVKIYEEDPTFDLVVLDIEMPGLNGFAATKLIRQYQVAKRPYIIGTSAQFAHSEKAIKIGMDVFVVKPAENKQLD